MTAPAPAARPFIKHYPQPAACRTAAANYHWLATLGSTLRLPRLVAAGTCQLAFEYVHGRHAVPGDLVSLAGHLGDLHGVAHVKALHRAHLDTSYVAEAGHPIPDFLTPRLGVLRQRLADHVVPEPRLNLQQAIRLLEQATAGPAAIYKDANPRNFLLTRDGPVMVDVDDLTLAPFGYDLAKLVVTLAMTHGPIPRDDIHRALGAYNRATRRHDPELGRVTRAWLLAWAEIHHILTSPYLGRHGYHYGWHTPGPAILTSADRLPEGVPRWP